MKLRVVVLGAGFGGLELSTLLSEALGEQLDLTLLDKNDSFYFGFSKLDVMFGCKAPETVRLAYRNIAKPGVQFRQEVITAIAPETRRVTTDKGAYEADVLVIALGADYDQNATLGLVEGGNEFYSFAGAERLRAVLPTFSKGSALHRVRRRTCWASGCRVPCRAANGKLYGTFYRHGRREVALWLQSPNPLVRTVADLPRPGQFVT
jgi:sulfide:quinone oxidoreductase